MIATYAQRYNPDLLLALALALYFFFFLFNKLKSLFAAGHNQH